MYKIEFKNKDTHKHVVYVEEISFGNIISILEDNNIEFKVYNNDILAKKDKDYLFWLEEESFSL